MTNVNSDNLVEIGFFKKSFGLKGHLRFHQHSPELRTIFKVSKIYIESKEFVIEEVRDDLNSPIIKLSGMNTKEDSSSLSNKKVHIAKNDLPDAPTGKFYQSDLINSEVINNGKIIGSLKEIIETGENNVYVISLQDGGEILVPNVPEFILKVDIANNIIEIIMPEVI
ncbi:MAG: 16S rRNA processing protein RimM [Chloroflexi bacterium]|nr:16S rRNA processing protein RimM [Chloroflexota bacterium]